MPTERIDIILTERGSRQVKRNIEDVAAASDRAESELDQLRRSLNNISPTAELNRTLQQIQSLRQALAAPRTRASWLSTPIADANVALIQIGQNLRAARVEMGTNVEWDAVSEFRQAEEELNDVIRKLQAVRRMQTDFISSNNVRDRTTGLAPTIPNVVTLPEVNRFARDAERAARGAGSLSDGVDRLGTSARGAHRPFMLLDRYVGAFGAGIIASELMRLSDSATVVANRINIVSDSTGEAQVALDELYNIARRTRSPIEEMSSLYQKAMMASQELGITQQDALQFVETIGMGLAIQGSSAQTARGALIQLSQAIGTDIVRAEEFNSILEGAYPIALAAARGIDEAGGSVARLRRMVIDGEITSQQFFEAIMSQYPMIADMFGQTESTISQAFTVFKNELTEYISTSEEAQIISGALADSILLIADNIEPIADILFSIGAALAFSFAARKVALVATAATNLGAVGAALAGMRALLGFAGGPIVGGLALLAGAAFWVYQNTDTAADKIERLHTVMNNGVDALESYNALVQAAADEQEELGGVINLTTEAMLRQSRAQLQDALRELQSGIRDMENEINGTTLNPFNMDNVRAALAELAGPGFNMGVVAYGNAELENLYNLLKAVEDGTGTIDDFVAAVNRVRGVGPEVTRAADDLAIALEALPEDLAEEPSAQAQRWLTQAEEQLTNIATLIGGFEEQVNAVAAADALPEKVEALQALQAALETAQQAGSFVSGSSWVKDTADLLNALQQAREQEALMLEALGANADVLQDLTEEANRFRQPLDGSAAAAGQTEATLDRINFSPLQQGARGFADELIRAATAVELIRGRSGSLNIPSNNGQPQVIQAAYTPGTMAFAASGTGGGLDDATYGAMLAALADYGVATLDTTLSTMGSNIGQTRATGLGAGGSILEGRDRTGQSEEYVSVLQSINQELDSRHAQMVLNNEALEQEKMLYDVMQRARQEGAVLDQQDIALIQQRVEALTELQRKLDLVNQVGDALFNNLESSLNSFVENGSFSFNEFASSVIKDLARIGIQTMITAPLKNFFGGIMGNLIPGLSLPGFNEGADFTVGGTGGVDKNVVAFRASRGERVQVTPAGKDTGDGGNQVNFYITTPDVAGFQRSEAQMAARAQRMLARGQRNS